MAEKKSFRIPISEGEKQITFELKNDVDLIEILSLKFSQTDVYSSGLCSDYGVVVGRITANAGFGIPNVRISIFVPEDDLDINDPVIHALYPYTQTTDTNTDGYRYNLLPTRQQHGGHTPTGTFPDQTDILNREEYLEVFEKYYNFTVKTNESGDFMIWGVPVGAFTLHVDVDLSDIGCFSLRPYDFIRKGVGEDEFERSYKFKSSTNLNSLPQIISYDKTIEITPFIGNEELCQIGITRSDFDLSEVGIKIEPITLVLMSSFMDDDSDAIKRTGSIKKNTGFKCKLQTTDGMVECIRHTGRKVYGSDGVTLYPELETFNITETINQDGNVMVILPMNLEYVYTNEFGEREITNDSNLGIPTTAIARFRFSLNTGDGKVTTAKYLVPNIREYTDNVIIAGKNDPGCETQVPLITTYTFSTVFEDYLKIPDGAELSAAMKSDKKALMLGECIGCEEGVPQDYFYKFNYGKVYTVSSFQGSTSREKKNAFLGIKEIRPADDNECSSTVNYFPTNFGYQNKSSILIKIQKFMLYIQSTFNVITVVIAEILGGFFYGMGQSLYDFLIPIIKVRPFKTIGQKFMHNGYRIASNFALTLPLTIYPECDECGYVADAMMAFSSATREFCKMGELRFNLRVDANHQETPGAIYSSTGSYAFLYLDYNSENTNYITSAVAGTSMTGDGKSARDPLCTGTTSEIPYTSLRDLWEEKDLNYPDTLPPRYRGDFTSYPYPSAARDNFTDFTRNFDTPNNTGKILLTEPGYIYTYTGLGYEYIDPSFIDPFGIIYTPTHFRVDDTDSALRATISSDWGQSGDGPGDGYHYYECQYWPVVHCDYVYVEILPGVWGYQLGSPGVYFRLSPGDTTLRALINTEFGDSGDLWGGDYYYVCEHWPTLTGCDYTHGTYTEGPDAKPYGDGKLYNKLETDGFIKYYTSEWINISQSSAYVPLTIYTNLAILQIYDYSTYVSPPPVTPTATLPSGCEKYNSFYNSDSSDGDDDYIRTFPHYDGGGILLYTEGSNGDSTPTVPPYVEWSEIGRKDYPTGSQSGKSEIRDGVIVVVPDIGDETSQNPKIIREWRRRQSIGLSFCSGIVNYTFIDNWLSGVFYFFKFKKKIKWDNQSIYDLNVRSSKYPRDLVFFNIYDNTFYYRSTPYNPSYGGFIGFNNILNLTLFPDDGRELLHPTTFYDVGVRDEFLKEICYDSSVDPTCSVIRDIGNTTYQDPAEIIEFIINLKMKVNNGKYDIDNFFKGANYGNGLDTLNGDIVQLMSTNCEAGIEEFDVSSPNYALYNSEILNPETLGDIRNYFGWKGDPEIYSYGPTPIDFNYDENGEFVRLCLNYSLSDTSQIVPFYLWDKRDLDFGETADNFGQRWDREVIATGKLQGLPAVNYNFSNGEQEYLLPPINKAHPTFPVATETSYNIDLVDKFTMVTEVTLPSNPSNYNEGDVWLVIPSGDPLNTVADPQYGDLWILVGNVWKLIPPQPTETYSYVNYTRELFLFETARNYNARTQTLSTPFMFYFGLRPRETALDLLTKNFGPKGAFPSVDE